MYLPENKEKLKCYENDQIKRIYWIVQKINSSYNSSCTNK